MSNVGPHGLNISPMSAKANKADVAVIGGGLAGIVAAIRLSQAGSSVVLIDCPLPEARGKLGGFARFSGAKFSFPPAGLGLVPVAGSLEQLNESISQVIEILGISACARTESPESDANFGGNVVFRRYHSILLPPEGVEAMLDRLTAKVAGKATVVQGKATELNREDSKWKIAVNGLSESCTHCWTVDAVFYAAGRLSEGVLLRAGAIPSDGKGLDVGVRLEFENRGAAEGLINLGADAKILRGKCRTFCLNSPGQIYRYPFRGITIAGGIVADASIQAANVGILLRVQEKERRIEDILRAGELHHKEMIVESARFRTERETWVMPEVLPSVIGVQEAAQLREFIQELSRLGLVNTRLAHRVHMPLLDWHWHTFSSEASHKTSLPNVFALGDSSGHARGLLQAAVSGWLAAQEYL